MNSIFLILNSCTVHEKGQLLEFCATRNSTRSKKYQLLKAYVDKPGSKDGELSKLIYGKNDSGAFSQLKKRVKEELEELLILLNTDSFSDTVKARIRCGELLLQSQILLARGLHHEGAKQLEKSLKHAISGEFPDLILSIFDTSQRFGVNEVIRRQDLPDLELVIKSHLQILVNQHSPKKEELVKNEKNTYLGQILRQLNTDRKTWGLVANIRQSLANHNFEETKTLIQKSEEIFSEHPDDREVYEEFFLAKQQYLLQTGQYKEVIQNCKIVNSSLIQSKENSVELAQYQWYALFHQGCFDEAMQVLKKSLMRWSPEYSGKWKYLEAFLLFRQKSFKNALRLIHECQLDLKSLPNYYLGSKMLELMILFDQQETDWLNYKVENFRKLLSRWKGRISIRIDSGFQVLHGMQDHLPIHFKNELEKNVHLQHLQSGQGQYSWDPIDFELVRYDGWLEEHFA
jgi:tetratricopeptide (TPR) repeat protein